jgi:DNA-binding NarL/FixJ family response regulator
MEKIKLLLVDDHKLLLKGLVSLFTGSDKFEIVGTANSAEDAINKARTMQLDVILMDIKMQGMSGLEACRWIKDQHEYIKIILLSMEVRKDFLSIGIQSGISGYLAKDIDDQELFRAVEAVHRGEQYFTEAITKLVFEDYFQQQKIKTLPKGKLPEELTKRELEVVQLVAHGMTNKQIAESLFISVKTVETHKSHILDKLGLSNSGELMKFAHKNNLVALSIQGKP